MKKRFGVPQETTDGLAKTLAAEQSTTSVQDDIETALIETDPSQPRKLRLNTLDPRQIEVDSEDFERQRRELDEIEGLAASIASVGLIEPITVYRHGHGYRLVAGERRLLAHRLLGRKYIPANVRAAKPTKLRLVQLAENLQRVDLDLAERVGGIREVLGEMVALQGEPPTADQLATETGLKKAAAYRYIQVAKAPDDVHAAIRAGLVTTLVQAAEISQLPPSERTARYEAIRQARAGQGDDGHQSPEPIVPNLKRSATAPKAPVPAGSVALGRTTLGVLERLVESVGGKRWTKAVDWSNRKAALDAFRKLVKAMERGEL